MIHLQKVDFHLHTNCSDGQYSPNEVVKKAVNNGINFMAITDHDTISGLFNLDYPKEKIKVVNGIEFSTSNYKEMHILGYNFDKNDKLFLNELSILQQARKERKNRIIDYLKNYGITLTDEDLDVKSDVVARPHFAKAMVKKGYVSSIEQAFLKYLATDEFYKIDRQKPKAEEIFSLLKKSKGISVLAHPYSLNLQGEALFKEVSLLKEQGLMGIECFYSLHTKEFTTLCLDIAKRLDLLVTAGSDFHGEDVRKGISMGMECNSYLMGFLKTVGLKN